ncbi:hypothetical protein Tco_1288357, partial [Tanacetum coccineum]
SLDSGVVMARSTDPNGWTWVFEFQSFGRIVDAFIANKRSKQGKHFRFIRFLGVHNEEVFAKSPSNVSIGNYHVFIAVARFQRNPKNDASSFNKPHSVNSQLPRTAQPRPNLSTNVSSEIPPKKSYASVAHAETNSKEIRQNKFENVKSIQLTEDDLINVEDTSSVVMVKVKEIDTISNIYRVCQKIHYVGGLWVWIQFLSVKSCDAFKFNKSLKKLWTSIKDPSPSFVVDERMHYKKNHL